MGSSVLAAMSGGVDSSVAAAVLHRAGHRVIGATIKTFCYAETDGPSNACCGLEGIADARAVAGRLGIPHFVYDAGEAFAEDVIDDFVSEYAAGRTPIPCVRCNSFTKFRDLLGRADALGCEFMATGHYARVRRREGSPARLCRAADERKDQTYFLWAIPREALERLLLPVGDLAKPRVRALARELDLATAEKPESFEICFVPDNDYRGVLRVHLGEDHPALSPGPLVLRDGTPVGEHTGYADFTVGQRRGLPGGFDRPMFVLEIRPASREVVIGPRDALATSRLEAGRAHWLVEDPPCPGERLGVRIRHGAPIVEAEVVGVSSGAFVLELGTPRHAVTPGQSAVLYRQEVVVGGGVITRSGESAAAAASAAARAQ
ncbi:MAG TPA: tRNA 2-thiouridine(34) synthase MnmA [Gemmatimonadota bacterium]|nr:tRNA 2-thiouridine(34) synthase MnmA [Gemmatimonadota bacterium]